MRLLFGSLASATALRLRVRSDDPIVQPIQVEEISTESSGPVTAETTTTAAPYKTNVPGEYAIPSSLNETLGANELAVNVTVDALDLCNNLVGQVRIDAGCMRNPPTK
jgi:hypothetical protein